MTRHRLGAAAVALLLGTTALFAGCQDDDGQSAPPLATTSSASADPSSSTLSERKVASAEPEIDRDSCVRAEQRAARDIWLWQAVSEVTGAPTGYSETARDTVVHQAAKVERRLLATCDERAPAAFERFAAEIRPAVRSEQFGAEELDGVLAAWLRWGSDVGAPKAARSEIRELAACRQEFFPAFDASYRIWWKWTETGKAWWIDITFDNRTGKVLDGGMGGTARATGLREDPFGWEKGPRPGPGKDAVLSWGGSSAEVLELQPGTTTMRAAPDIDQDVHTTADGTFRVTELSVGLGPRGERYGCSPPVRPVPW